MKTEFHKGKNVILVSTFDYEGNEDCSKCTFKYRNNYDCSDIPCVRYERSDKLNGYFIDAKDEVETPKKHKHHDLIVAWAADPSQTIQVSSDGVGWTDVIEPVFSKDYEYRFKPVTTVVFMKASPKVVSITTPEFADLKLTFENDVLTAADVLVPVVV